MSLINVRLVTPDKIVCDVMVEELILPTTTGQIGILKAHATLLTALDIGVMKLKFEDGWTSIVLIEGFAEVNKDIVTVVSNGAESSDSIDFKVAEDELKKAIVLAEKAKTSKEKMEKTLELRKARARLEAVVFTNQSK